MTKENVVKNQKFYNFSGRPITPDELEEEKEYILAVSENDSLVKLTGYYSARVDHESGFLWFYIDEQKMPKGFSKLIKSWKKILSKEIQKRKNQNLPYKNFQKTFQFLGNQIVYEEDIRSEILAKGLENWLKEQ